MGMYSIGEFSKLINKSVKTLQRWDREDKLNPSFRDKGNRRNYTHDQYLEYIGKSKDIIKRKNIAYCRVSSSNQKNDLKSQKEYINTFSLNAGISIDEVISDIGSGLNYKRPNFIKLLKDIKERKIDKLIIAHKDRLVRFGYEMVEFLCNEYNTEILIINDERLSPEQEVTNDLMTIIHVFSYRLYGLRKYKKEIKNICENGEK